MKKQLMNETAIRKAMEFGIIPESLGEKMIAASMSERVAEYPKEYSERFAALAACADKN